MKPKKTMTEAQKKNAKMQESNVTVTKSGRKIKTSISSSYPKALKPGSMATQSRIVEVKPAKKASTKYSPAPMSASAKKKAATRGAIVGSLRKMGIKETNLDKIAKARKK